METIEAGFTEMQREREGEREMERERGGMEEVFPI